MQRSHFASYILILMIAWLQVYAAVRDVYGGHRLAEEQAHRARESYRKLEHRLALEREAFVEFQQDVATLLPNELKTKGRGGDGYALRTLASVVTPGPLADPQAQFLAKSLFEQGTREFDQKNYAASVTTFEKLIQKFGYTHYVPRAYFLLADALYQMNELEQSTETIQRMIQLFPIDESTGLAMVRLGHIYEERKLNDLAVDVYKTVLRTFPQRDIAAIAKSSLRGIEL